MKKYISATAATANSMVGFSELETLAHDAGYELSFSHDGALQITAFRNKDILPQITATIKDEFDGHSGYYYDVDVKYPSYHSNQADYVDDMEYQVEQFMEAAKFVTALSKWHS